MNLPVVLTRRAKVEFDAAADWYEAQAQLGEEFTAHVREILERIGRKPESFAILHRDTRRARLDRFPYNVFFRIRADRTEVIAVLHAHRDPSVWKRRT